MEKVDIKTKDGSYFLHSKVVDNDSNYNKMIYLSEAGSKTPLAGTTAKESDELDGFIRWGLRAIYESKNTFIL